MRCHRRMFKVVEASQTLLAWDSGWVALLVSMRISSRISFKLVAIMPYASGVMRQLDRWGPALDFC